MSAPTVFCLSVPAGLTLDPSTGVIWGSLATAAASVMPYAVSVTVDNGNGGSATQTFSWIVNDAALTVQGASFSATEGIDTDTVTLANFTTSDLGAQAGDFTALVDWGDTSVDSADVEGEAGSFTVSAGHVYAETGSYAVRVVVTASGGSTATVSDTASVADAALTLSGGFGLGALKGQLSTLTVATFTDANAAALPSDYSALIDWGDGSSSNGTIPAPPGSLRVSGAHVYAARGTYTVTVTLTDADGVTATTTSTVFVGELYAGLLASLSVSSFVDADSTAPAGDFTATIDWGDGSSPSVVQPTGSGGIFTLPVVTHTYVADSVSQPGGFYPVTVTIADEGGSTLAGAGTVVVVRPPLTLYVGDTVTPPGTGSLSNAEVAVFTEADDSDGVSEFGALLTWGDGTSSSGTVTRVGHLFRVLGSHTYDTDGQYVIQVEVSQRWDALIPAARAAELVLAVPVRPRISGPHVVLGVSQDQFDRDPHKLPGFHYSVSLPDPLDSIFRWGMQWTVDKEKYADASMVRRYRQGGYLVVEGKVTFLNKAEDIVLGLRYRYSRRADPQNAWRETLPFRISIVQLDVAALPAPELNKKTTREIWKPSRFGRVTNLPAVIISTRPDRRYNVETLEGPEGPALDNELKLGVVSFKAWVILRGTGDDQTKGVAEIKLGWLQDIVSTTVKSHYAGGGSGEFKPLSRDGEPLPPPWLDSDRPERTGVPIGTPGDSSFTRSSTTRYEDRHVGGKRAGKSARVVSLDAPQEGFLFTYSSAQWTSTSGALTFVNHLTAYSANSPFTYMVLGRVQWAIHFVGSRNGDGLWVPDATQAKIDLPDPAALDFTGGPRVGALPAYGAQLASFNASGPTFDAATNGSKFTYRVN